MRQPPTPGGGVIVPPLDLSNRAVHDSIRAVVGNWLESELAYLLASRFRRSRFKTVIRFKREPLELTCGTTGDLAVSLCGIHVARLLGQNASEIAQRVLAIGAPINEKLIGRFTGRELRRSATGGSTGLKEALLFALVRFLRPQVVIETGVAQGVSTNYLLSALNEYSGGRLISIDLPNVNPRGYRDTVDPTYHDPVYVKSVSDVGWLVPMELRDRWELNLGSSREVLKRLGGQIDLFYHDSLHTYENMLMEFRWAWTHLRGTGLLVADDVGDNAAFTDFAKEVASAATVLSKDRVGVIQKM